MKRWRHVAGMLLAGLATAAAIAACGGTAGNAAGSGVAKVSTSTVKCGMGTGKRATGKPIEVRAMATASGGINFSSAPLSAAAYFKCVNANGGIHGRPIAYSWRDDGLNQQTAAQIASAYAADHQVVALAGDATFIGCAVANPIYKKAGLYSITGTGVTQACFNSSNIAPVNAGPEVGAVATLQYLYTQHKATRIAQESNSVPGVGDWTQAGLEAYAKQHGIKVVDSVLHDPSSINASAIALAFKHSNATAAVLEDPGPQSAAVLKAAATQNLEKSFTWSCLSSCYEAGFPTEVGPQWNGLIANSELQLVNAKTPDNLLWLKVLQKYGTPQDPRDTFGQSGFLAAKILTDTLLKMNPDDITRSTVSRAILGIKGYKSDMFCTPWSFGKGSHHYANHTTRTVEIKNGQWVQVQGCRSVPESDLVLPSSSASKSS